MNLKNKIAVGLCVAVATVSFLHPFSGKIVYAEQAEETSEVNNETEISEEAETEETGEETEEAETEETGEETEETEDLEISEEIVKTEEEEGNKETEEIESNIFEENLAVAVLSVASEDGSIGISAVAPEEGQENRYEYTGSEEEWTVPFSGYYAVYCYGAQGGRAEGDSGNKKIGVNKTYGMNGTLKAGCAKLMKGMRLTLHVGGAANRTKAGWSDGGSGKPYDSDRDYSIHAGGGGGSTYILYNNTKIISAGGGAGGTAVAYWVGDGDITARVDGAHGGGVTELTDAEDIIWDTDRLDVTEEGVGAGNGSIVIEVVKVFPTIVLDAPADWTREDVQITAEVISEGEGLPDQYLSWETDEEGNDIWTDVMEYTVSQNGTYTCKIRDVAGNIGETTIEITGIDRLQPEGDITADITDWTREDVQLTVAADDAEETTAYGKSGLMEKAYLWGQKNEEGETVYEMTETVDVVTGETRSEEAWTGTIAYTASQNGTYLCRIRDKAGNETVCEYIVTNIDRTAPKITYDRPGKWYEGSVNVIWQGNDLQPDGSEGCGLHELAYSYDGINFDNQNRQLVEKEGKYCVWVRDRLGNVGMSETIFFHDKKKETGEDDSEGTEMNWESELPAEEISPEKLTLPKSVEQNTGNNEMSIEINEMQHHEPKREWPRTVAVPESLVYQEGEEQKESREAEKEKKQLIEKKMLKSDKVSVEVSQKKWNVKRVILYSVWMAVIFCGLLWLLFCLLFEHATVYCREKGGSYCKIGRCAILRKKEYLQINLIRFMKKKENRDYMLRFSGVFVWLHKKRKVLVRTGVGVELRNMTEKIEILSID